MSIISKQGGDTMDVVKFCDLLFSLYCEQENVNIDYQIFLKSDVSKS